MAIHKTIKIPPVWRYFGQKFPFVGIFLLDKNALKIIWNHLKLYYSNYFCLF